MKFNEIYGKWLSRRNLLIVFIIGLVIMIVPGFKDTDKKTVKVHNESYASVTEKDIEKIIKQVDGVKKVKVLITYKNGGVVNYAYDVNRGANQNDLEIKINDKEPLVISKSTSEIKGIAAIVYGNALNSCEIADILKAVTGVGLHRISVKVYGGG